MAFVYCIVYLPCILANFEFMTFILGFSVWRYFLLCMFLTFFLFFLSKVYKGYVDDPRNTDNAWIETTALNFHDETGATTSMITLDARDDATDATWIDIDEKLDVYETHLPLLEFVLNCNLSDRS